MNTGSPIVDEWRRKSHLEADHTQQAMDYIHRMDYEDIRELGEQSGIVYGDHIPDEWAAVDLITFHMPALIEELERGY